MAEAEEDQDQTAFDADTDTGDDTAASNGTGEYDPDDLPQVIDLSQVKPSSYEAVPKGWYEGYIDSVEYKLSESKGLPMLDWTLKYEYGENEDGTPRERTIHWYTTLAGDGAGRTVAALAKLDPDLDLATFAPDEADAHFSGWTVNMLITVRPDRDNRKIKRNNVADVEPVYEE